MSECLQPHEFLEKLKVNPDYTVLEILDTGIYSLMVVHKDIDGILYSRGTFRRSNCRKYINKRETYIAGLKEVIIQRNLSV